MKYLKFIVSHSNAYESDSLTDRSSRRPAPPQCAPSGEPTRCCTWSRSGWPEWPCSTGWPACSWLCRPPPAPSRTRAAAQGGLKGRFPADRRGRWSHRPLRGERRKQDGGREGRMEEEMKGKMKGGGEVENRGGRMERGWRREGEESRQETVGQCIITTVFAWDYPSAQHTVKSLSFDILECLHKCILEHRKFWDSSQAIRLRGFTETGPCSV